MYLKSFFTIQYDHVSLNQELIDKLTTFLQKGKDWERKPIMIPGVFLLKLPPYKSRPASLVIEVNPVNVSGTPTKKRGSMLRTSSDLKELIKVLDNTKLEELAHGLDKITASVMLPGRWKKSYAHQRGNLLKAVNVPDEQIKILVNKPYQEIPAPVRAEIETNSDKWITLNKN